jgi:uncharacterized protein DUF4012
VGAVGWYLGARILGVRDDLVAAQAAVAQVRAGGDVRSGVRTVAEHSARAANDTRDPLWRAAEQLPNFGENLRAVRIAATALDQLAGGLAVPALDALDADTKEPVLKRVLPVLQRAAPEVTALNRQFADVRAVELMPQVREGVDQIAAVTGAIDPVLQLLPGMLGANGPRNYLLVAQSNAEVLALGGSVASQSLLRAADGSIAIVKQADSTDYISGKPVRTDIDKSAIDLYNDYLVTHLNTSVGRPDFPTAAKTIQAFWNRDIDPAPVDGVISVDPLALARALRATGPVTVDKHRITSDNAVSFLLSRAYDLYPPEKADEIFKQVAVLVMDKLARGSFDAAKLVDAVSQGIDTGSIMFWSADPAIQARFASTRVAGILPRSNAESTTIGVFYRDASLGSKIDYYLKATVDARASCKADGSVSVSVSTTVWLDLDRARASKLPSYVTGGALDGKVFRTQLFIYGPPGTKVSAESRQPKKSWNWRPITARDLGRPTPSFMTVQDLGAKKVTVKVTFTGPRGEYGPLQVRTTPIVNPTKVTIDSGCLGR